MFKKCKYKLRQITMKNEFKVSKPQFQHFTQNNSCILLPYAESLELRSQ